MTHSEPNKIKGGLADGKTVEDLAKKHGVSVDLIEKQLTKGIKIELEHTNDKKIAKEISLDHLWEDPKYYDKLSKIEESITKTLIRKALNEFASISIVDEAPNATEYQIKYNDRLVGKLKISKEPKVMGKDTVELIGIGYTKDYIENSMKITIDVIRALWQELSNINRILLQPKAESRGFWAKMGATRLNDTFYMLNRGY